MNQWISIYLIFGACFAGFNLGHQVTKHGTADVKTVIACAIIGYIWPAVLIGALLMKLRVMKP